MDAKTYEKRRNELVRLIERGLALGHIPARTVDALREVRRKVFENQFRIVLVAGFESGKSTTFNLLCDGQEISPRGLKVPTSATIVSAQNTLDPALVGKASVVWRSDRELTLIFAKALLRYFKEAAPERFKTVEQADRLSEELRYPEDIPLIRAAVARRIADLGGNGQLDSSERDAVLMAHLIAEFYSDPWILGLKARKDFTVGDIAELICFPKNYRRRWMDVPGCAYRPQECAFAFIRQVHCYIKSEALMRTGSVIIDCPGLFASAYDSKVAFDVLENADVVWYILNGKAAGESDLMALKQIAAAKPGKIFYGVNLMENGERQVREESLGHYITTIGEATGAELKPEDFHLYHALLGLTALQARKQKAGLLDEHSRKAVMRIAAGCQEGVASVEEALTEAACGALKSAYGVPIGQLARLDLFGGEGRGAESCLARSGIEEVVAAVENEVVGRKARSILIDNGARRAAELIQEVESDLKVAETVAQEDETRIQAEFERAEAALDEFQEFCENQLDLLRSGGVDHALAVDYWEEVIYGSIGEVADRAARQIARNNCNEVRQDLNAQIINDTFAEVVKPKAVAWADRIKGGRHDLFNDLVVTKMSHIIRETARKWKLTIQDQPILAGLPTPSPVVGTEIVDAGIVDAVVAKAPGVSTDVVLGATIGVTVGAFVGSFIFPFIGTCLGTAIGALVGTVIGGGTGTERRGQEIYEGVRRELVSFVARTEQVEAVVRKQEKRIESLRLGIIEEFRKAFERPAVVLRQRHLEAQDLFAAKSSQRQEIAEAHRLFRLERLEPLRKEIEGFVGQVQKDLAV